jgi:predicted MFS family arabinose efflux permease
VSYLIAFVLISAFVRVEREVHDDEESRGVRAGLRYLRGDRLVARVSISSLTFGFLFPILAASFPVLAYQQYHHNPRVAGLLFSAMGAGQVVGSLLAYRLVTKLRPLRMAAFAAVFTAAPLWLLVPHLSLPVVGIALAICGASVPLINAPYLGLLSTRIPKALRGTVIQALLTINTIAGPLAFVIAGPLFVHAGLHAAYALIAVLATFASVNFILATRAPGAQAAA